MVLQTIIGLKRLEHAKQRLMPHVSASERRRLMLDMLATVVVATRAARLGPVALATSEPTAAELVQRLGVVALPDGDLPWNEGLVHALGRVHPAPDRLLYLAGDLPLVTAADLVALVAQAPSPGVAIARARDGGTNALLVTPPRALRPAFGAPRSSDVHVAAARSVGLPWAVVDIPGLALDVDTIDDARDAGLVAAGVNGTGRAPAAESPGRRSPPRPRDIPG